ncbi:hypothetical protein GORGEOUS_53 [Arthrobacter phage Gorgeous]|uniref:Uncharacterized protein n=2 Tax=Amigovirus amigo TaxID=1982100 RepID=A0A0U3TMU5_9CAUD|nr:hypothetical protein GORGEOUS_53 [Arthrobacter phage Gorgeous]ALY10393.1 hypothetical protein SORJUANA_53 [Arthrobacter phage SorJuana]
MPIRVRIERVGYYEQYPDKQFHDILITNTEERLAGMVKYTVEDRITGANWAIYHEPGTGVEALATDALGRWREQQ